MNAYCTYFDRNYLAQGLALWRSLERHDPLALLTVLALDDETAAILARVGGARLHVLERHTLLGADPALAALERGRTRTEFIFALTPCLVRHLLRTRPDLGRVAYLDADLYFFGAPQPIWEELGDHSVLIVPHRYPNWHDDSALYGRYNVGVVGIRQDDAGHACVEWWRERCLESTALTRDGAHFGDQKYLDEWPRRFAGVAVSGHPGVNVAPWNWCGHDIRVRDGGVTVDGMPLVVFHFAQFRRISASWFDSGQLEYGIMPLRLRSRLYGEYWSALEQAEREVRAQDPAFAISRCGWRASLGAWHLAVLRLCWGQFWCRIGTRWIAGRGGLGRCSGRFMGFYRRRRRRRA